MSTTRWACLSLLMLLGAERTLVRAGPTAPAASPKKVQLDVVLTRVRPGLKDALAKRLLARRPRAAIGAVRKDRPIASTLASPRGATAFLSLLQHLETEGVANILSKPRLVTVSGRPASFLEGREQALPVPAGLGSVGVQFEEVGIRLNVLPTILSNGRIRMEVEAESSYLGRSETTEGPGEANTRITHRFPTTTELAPGQTLVYIGIPHQEPGTTKSVPLLEGVPVLGQLGTSDTPGDKYEFVILVTPTVLP